MTIDDLKRALVEVRELCANVKCSSCPLAKRDDANVPYCPLVEDEDGFRCNEPAYWDIDDWEEGTHATD